MIVIGVIVVLLVAFVSCTGDEYARGDRAAVEAGALDYLNTIKVVLRKS